MRGGITGAWYRPRDSAVWRLSGLPEKKKQSKVSRRLALPQSGIRCLIGKSTPRTMISNPVFGLELNALLPNRYHRRDDVQSKLIHNQRLITSGQPCGPGAPIRALNMVVLK